jgi:hypothetical protein
MILIRNIVKKILKVVETFSYVYFNTLKKYNHICLAPKTTRSGYFKRIL